MLPIRLLSRALAIGASCLLIAATFTETASARSIRSSDGYTGQHTHATWAGPGVGLTAWTVATDFTGYTPCHSSQAGLEVDSAWNSASLHNGAELDLMFS